MSGWDDLRDYSCYELSLNDLKFSERANPKFSLGTTYGVDFYNDMYLVMDDDHKEWKIEPWAFKKHFMVTQKYLRQMNLSILLDGD